jgi:hypothetical protein
MENTTVGICRADYAAPLYPQKFTLISPTSDGSSVGIDRSRTQATGLVFYVRTSHHTIAEMRTQNTRQKELTVQIS